ncbi:hypothetical protein EV715DRAFT_249407 [Schizophyllum commune]
MRRPWSPSSDPSVEAVDFSEYQRAITNNPPYDDRQYTGRSHEPYDPRYDNEYSNDNIHDYASGRGYPNGNDYPAGNDFTNVVSPVPRHAPAPFSPPLSPPAMTVASHSSADSYGGMSSFAAASNPSVPQGAAPRQHYADPFTSTNPYHRESYTPSSAELDITSVGRRPFSHPPEPAHTTHYYPESDYAPPSPYRFNRSHASHPSSRRGTYDYNDPFASRPSLAGSQTSRNTVNNPFDPAATIKHGGKQRKFKGEGPYGNLDSTTSYGYDDPFSAPSYGPPSYGHEPYIGARSYGGEPVLPWGPDDDADRATITDEVKEERVRMLEERFSSKPSPTSRPDPDDAGEYRDPSTGALVVGTADRQGDLVTQGPRKRLAVRILQVLFAIGAGIPAIWAALFVHPKKDPSLKGSTASYVLYVWGAIGFVLIIAVYFIHPCMRRRKFAKARGASVGGLATTGMMVLPVMQQGGKKKNKGMKGKKGRGPPPPGDVQVNLIVDPAMFGRGRDEEDESEEEEPRRERRGGEPPGGWDGDSSSAGFWKDEEWGAAPPSKKKRKPRRSVMVSLAAEKHWERARSYTHKLIWVDGAMLVIYFAVFIFSAIGGSCTAGDDGKTWCTAYDASRACACITALSFGITIFFGVKDLAASKTSPRQRGV